MSGSIYGYCPKCGDEVLLRERRPNGNDTCKRGHQFPSSETLTFDQMEGRFPSAPAFIKPAIPAPVLEVERTETQWFLGELQVLEALRWYLGLPADAKITVTDNNDQPLGPLKVSYIQENFLREPEHKKSKVKRV